MQENIEQRYAIKLCVKLNKSASLTEAYGDATISKTMVFKWQKAFKEGRENVEDDPRSGRSIWATKDQNVEVVRAVQRVRRDTADDSVLHHDIAPAHTVLSIREFLAKK
jgi:transposase